MPKLNRNIHQDYIDMIVALVKRNKKVDLFTIANTLGVTPHYLKYTILKVLVYHYVGSSCIINEKDKTGVEYLVWICEEK